jgi:hypothetical protein
VTNRPLKFVSAIRSPMQIPEPRLHLVHDCVIDAAVCGVPPPREHVGALQHSVAEPVLGLVQRGGARFDVTVLVQRVGDALMHALGIERGDELALLFVDVLTPNSDANGHA